MLELVRLCCGDQYFGVGVALLERRWSVKVYRRSCIPNVDCWVFWKEVYTQVRSVYILLYESTYCSHKE